MATITPSFSHLERAYIFPIIEEKLETLKQKSPAARVLNLGIGDVALPLAPSVARAITQAVEEMATPEGMRGYGPSQGYLFLREAIGRHAPLESDEIFISDGINTDALTILDLFSPSNIVAIPNPAYPAYLDACVLRGHPLLELPCTEETCFVPCPPKEKSHLIYLCSPNNPTGVAMTRAQLQVWVDYAREEGALILFDNAYEAFITSSDVPRSIFELDGAKECAIEFRSFSKSAGFTGLRCSYTLLPRTLQATFHGEKRALHPLWQRRQATKFNGVAYPIQRGAEAVYSEAGQQETRAQVALYLKHGKHLKAQLVRLGLSCSGGIDAPYIWVKTPQRLSSWAFFDKLLDEAQLLCIPGSGFGSCGEGFVRFSAFITEETLELALERLEELKI